MTSKRRALPFAIYAKQNCTFTTHAKPSISVHMVFLSFPYPFSFINFSYHFTFSKLYFSIDFSHIDKKISKGLKF